MRLGELNRKRVVTESGERLGRMHDVCGELRGSRLVLTGIVVGPAGFVEHFGLRFGRKGPLAAAAIPWTAVVRVAKDRIVVRDDAAP